MPRAPKVATIQESLVERRRELNLSQREVARRAEISSGLLSTLEAEQHEPTLSTLIRWCRALGLELSFHEAPR